MAATVKTTAVLGASPKPERYANMAVKALMDKGIPVVPVHPNGPVVHGIQALNSLDDIPHRVHTLTVYVTPAISSQLTAEILDLNPVRVIFNPGSENPALHAKLREAGIEVVEACTLVMLKTGAF